MQKMGSDASLLHRSHTSTRLGDGSHGGSSRAGGYHKRTSRNSPLRNMDVQDTSTLRTQLMHSHTSHHLKSPVIIREAETPKASKIPTFRTTNVGFVQASPQNTSPRNHSRMGRGSRIPRSPGWSGAPGERNEHDAVFFSHTQVGEDDDPPDLPPIPRSASMETLYGLGMELMMEEWEADSESVSPSRRLAGSLDEASMQHTANLARKARERDCLDRASALVASVESVLANPKLTQANLLPATNEFIRVLNLDSAADISAVFSRDKQSSRAARISHLSSARSALHGTSLLPVLQLRLADPDADYDFFHELSSTLPASLQLNYFGLADSLLSRPGGVLDDALLSASAHGHGLNSSESSLNGSGSDPLYVVGPPGGGSGGDKRRNKPLLDSHEVMTKFLQALQDRRVDPSSPRGNRSLRGSGIITPPRSPRPSLDGTGSPRRSALGQMQASALSVATQRWLAAKDKIIALKRAREQAGMASSGNDWLFDGSMVDSDVDASGAHAGEGSVDELVEAMAAETQVDPEYVEDFLLMYRELLSPPELLGKLLARFNIRAPDEPSPEEIEHYNKYKVVIQVRVITVIRRWVEDYWNDWMNEVMLDGLCEVFRLLIGSEFEALALQLASRVRERIDAFASSGTNSQVASSSVSSLSEMVGDDGVSDEGDRLDGSISSVGTPWSPGRTTVLDTEPSVVASALTQIEMEYFSRVRAEEFIAPFWCVDPDGELVSRAPNLVHYVKRFNIVASWVATEVCTAPDLRERVALIKRFVLIAQKLRALSNFNTLFAVLSGLNMPVVSRLSRTWARVSAKYRAPLAELLLLMDHSGNYRNYRKIIRRAEPPLIPFIGLLMADLAFIHSANAAASHSDLVNVERLRTIASIVVDIGTLQAAKTLLVVEPHVRTSFKFVFAASEAALVDASMGIEPDEFEDQQA